MKSVLLDENLDHRLRNYLGPNEVFTVAFKGWAGLKNGELLTVAETEGIEVFVTGDKTLTSEQNLSPRRISIVVLSAIEFLIIRNNVAAILAAIEASIPGSVQIVQCGFFRR